VVDLGSPYLDDLSSDPVEIKMIEEDFYFS